MAFSILGMGTAVPRHTMSTEQAISMSADCFCRTERQSRVMRAVFHGANVANRYTAVPYQTAYDWQPVPPRELTPEQARQARGPTTGERMRLFNEHASPLAAGAASSALEAADASPGDITHLVTVTCTGFAVPGIDIELIDRLGLPATVERLNVDFMGCHGAINGMRAALGLVAAHPSARVLLTATELSSVHYCTTWDIKRVVGASLFADGAAAIVAGHAGNNGDSTWHVAATGSCLVPDSRDAIVWRIGDHGYEMSLSNKLPELITENLRPWLPSWLASHGLTCSEVGSWAVHPGGPRIIDAVEQSLDLSPQATRASRDILREFGNMSSPTVLFVIDLLRRNKAPLPCVALGFGPGLVIEAALLR